MEDTEQKPDHDRDEINLWQCYQVILKRKVLIIAIFLVSVVAAGVISFILPPKYRITASIAPGWIDVDQQGKGISVDSADNIKSIIENGTCNTKIITSLKLDPVLYSKMEFKTKLSKNTETIYYFLRFKRY